MVCRVVPHGLIGLVASALLSTGCLLGPNYMRPEMPSPQQFRFVEGAQAESLADAPWFQVFDDPALQAIIKEAIASNLDLRAAVARVEEMRARAGIAKSFLYPQIDGGASYGAAEPRVGRPERADDEDTSHQSGDVRIRAFVGARSVRQAAARTGSGVGVGAGQRAGAGAA